MRVADPTKQVFRVVIAGSQEAIFKELTATDRPLGAIFNSRMHTTGLRPGGRIQMRTVSGGIEVTLTVDDVPVGTKTARSMQKGGTFMLDTLKSIVETGRPALGTRLMYVMFDALEFVLPAKTKSGRWPLERK